MSRMRNLTGDNDLIFSKTAFQSQLGGFECRYDHAIVDNFLGFPTLIFFHAFVHLRHDQFLIQRTGVHAYTNGLIMILRDFANGTELFISFFAATHITGVDPVFRKRLCTLWIIG